MELQVCLPPSFYISLKTYPVFTYINNTPSLSHLPAPLQRVAISKALTQIIKRERVWEKISRIVAAFPLRAFASMPIQEVTSFSPLSSAQPTPPSFPPPSFLSIQVNKLRCEFESVYPALCSASGSVISAIQIWRESYERPLPFVWRGEDYMNRMLGQVQAECSSMPKQRCTDFKLKPSSLNHHAPPFPPARVLYVMQFYRSTCWCTAVTWPSASDTPCWEGAAR
jgi:hypothetical protein